MATGGKRFGFVQGVYMKRQPQLVGPSPAVLKAIRSEMKKRGLTEKDRRIPSIARTLGAEQLDVAGLNEGIFYPEEDLPQLTLGLGPSAAARTTPSSATSGFRTCSGCATPFTRWA